MSATSAAAADGNHSDRIYDKAVCRLVPLTPPNSPVSPDAASKRTVTDTRCSGRIVVCPPPKPLHMHELIVLPRLMESRAWVTHVSLPLPAGQTPDTILEQLWKLQPLSRSEHGIMHGVRWDSGDRRRTLPVCQPGLAYRYNGSGWSDGSALQTFEQQPLVAALRDLVCQQISRSELPHPFNFCLINFYTGDGSIGAHSDSERDLEKGYPIASLSFSTAPRRFDVYENENSAAGSRVQYPFGGHGMRKWQFMLESGDLLVMGGAFQQLAKHAIPKHQMGADYRRVNLTFRMMKGGAAPFDPQPKLA